MPESMSGLRAASVWKTKASISMPPAAITQAMSAPKTPVAPAKRDGSVKMPDPIIDPTTIAISAGSASFCTVDCAIAQCL